MVSFRRPPQVRFLEESAETLENDYIIGEVELDSESVARIENQALAIQGRVGQSVGRLSLR